MGPPRSDIFIDSAATVQVALLITDDIYMVIRNKKIPFVSHDNRLTIMLLLVNYIKYKRLYIREVEEMEAELSEKPVQYCVSSFVSVKPRDVFKETSGQFPAGLKVTK